MVVTNTDEVARRANVLRDDFYRSDEPGVRWEQLSYRVYIWLKPSSSPNPTTRF